MLYVLVTEDGVDQICETSKDAAREKRDLEDMGCEVRVKRFPDWAAAQAFVDSVESR